MAKFQGMIGFIQTEETSPGVWTNITTERHYKGDIIRNSKQVEAGQQLNSDININNRFSVLLDPYTEENFPHIRYITWKGTSWSVSSVDINRPRLVISVRGVYNG